MNKLNKIYFHYGAMNASKSSSLLQAAYNYGERDLNVVLFKPNFDTRETTESKIISRIGLEGECVLLPITNEVNSTNDKFILHNKLYHSLNENIKAIFIDEVHFFSLEAFLDILKIAYEKCPDAPIMTYGLRNSFNGIPFPVVTWLLTNAEKLVEVKTICWCGSKATHNLMMDKDGNAIKDKNLNPIELGGNEKYISLCRTHWDMGKTKA